MDGWSNNSVLFFEFEKSINFFKTSKLVSSHSMAGFALAEEFIAETKERSDLNQYWYSALTISTIIGEISCLSDSLDGDQTKGRSLACIVSCPSIYFALPEHVRSQCVLLDLDTQFAHDPGFHKYDFNILAQEQLPPSFQSNFNMIIIDPPFVTREVWEKYARAVDWLATKEQSKSPRYICTTIHENAAMMSNLLGVEPQMFRPSIPNLVYQYSTYCNYKSIAFAEVNPEIDDDDWTLRVQRADEEAARKVGGESKCHDEPPPRQITGGNGKMEEDWRCLPVVEAKSSVVDVLPEVKVLLDCRASLGELKSMTNDICKTLLLMVRKADTEDSLANAIDLLSERIHAFTTEWSQGQCIISEAVALCTNSPVPNVSMQVVDLDKLVDDAKKLNVQNGRVSKGDYTKFQLIVKKVNGSIFRKMGGLLSLTKDIKKTKR